MYRSALSRGRANRWNFVWMRSLLRNPNTSRPGSRIRKKTEVLKDRREKIALVLPQSDRICFFGGGILSPLICVCQCNLNILSRKRQKSRYEAQKTISLKGKEAKQYDYEVYQEVPRGPLLTIRYWLKARFIVIKAKSGYYFLAYKRSRVGVASTH